MASKKITASQKSAAKKAALKPTQGKRSNAARATSGASNKSVARRSAAPKAIGKRVIAGAAATRRDVEPVAAPNPQQLAHGLRALLHTMQTVQRFEEPLCSIMHSIERKRPNAALLRELRSTLESLPIHEYLNDVEDLLHAFR